MEPLSVALGIPFVTFLLGLYLGHRLSLGRDRRKDFNTAADTLYIALDAFQYSITPKYPPPDVAMFIQVQRTIGWFHERRFIKTADQFFRTIADLELVHTNKQFATYKDPTRLKEECHHVMKLLRHR